MKRSLLALLLYPLTITHLHAQSSSATLDVVGWNIEWFGSATDGPANDNLQRENAKKIIRYLDADIYGLVEMVDTVQIRRLVDSLGSNYAYIISDFCSNATAPGSAAWRNGQKLMFLYKKNIFSNVKTRGLLRSSTEAYTNWASGRFPFLLNADVTIGSITKNINFIVIHGKAGSTSSDYDRRWLGAQELKDTLDQQFPNSMNIIFGDFNDALNQTISSNSGPESSYKPIIADSTDADHYKSITLPLAYAGQSSMTTFPNVIDNHVISNELTPYYVLNSAKIRTDITAVVPDFVTADNTSDHYPVFSNYSLAGLITSVPNIPPSEAGVTAYPNPFHGNISVKAAKTLTDVQVSVSDISGRVLSVRSYRIIPAGTVFQPDLPPLSAGIYFLRIETKQYRTVIKLIRL
ncbi:MAG: T9SS type A sorting domain-containing protein [Chitinophagaceae bacterium]|nr:T9SS type A sorting domain-containing protein [Chitinophagaceae bacterium]